MPGTAGTAPTARRRPDPAVAQLARVAVVGPRPTARGGIATVVRLMRESELGSEFRLEWISTQRDGPLASKLLEAARGLAVLAAGCVRGEFDLVHVHVSTGGSLARKTIAVAIARSTRTPVVLHVHSGGFFEDGGAGARRRAFRWILESADTVVALTEAWKRTLEARAGVRRVLVVPNAPDLPLRPEQRGAAARRVVLYLGHLYRAKGVHDLLEAFARLGASRPGLRLVLAGVGPEADALRRRAAELGLEDGGPTVDLPGWVGPHDKAALLAEAACLVLPSHNEGLPVALLEAMHAGVPVVATRVGGVPDVVEDGREALLVPPRDVDALGTALARIVDDRALADRLSAAARRRAHAEFSPEAMAARLSEVYRATLAARARPTPAGAPASDRFLEGARE